MAKRKKHLSREEKDRLIEIQKKVLEDLLYKQWLDDILRGKPEAWQKLMERAREWIVENKMLAEKIEELTVEFGQKEGDKDVKEGKK